MSEKVLWHLPLIETGDALPEVLPGVLEEWISELNTLPPQWKRIVARRLGMAVVEPRAPTSGRERLAALVSECILAADVDELMDVARLFGSLRRDGPAEVYLAVGHAMKEDPRSMQSDEE